MKKTAILSCCCCIALLAGGLGAVRCEAATAKAKAPEVPAAADQTIEFEVLSLTVSKGLKSSSGDLRDRFFVFDFKEAEEGTVLLAQGTPSGRTVLQENSCKLVSFLDDTGTDLLAPATKKRTTPGFGTKPLEFLRATFMGRKAKEAPNYFGMKVRGPAVPAKGASRVTAKVRLCFLEKGEEQVARLANVALQTNKAIKVGPLTINFRRAQTNAYEKAMGGLDRPWRATFQVHSNAYVNSAAFLCEDSDTPILSVGGLRSGQEASAKKPGESASEEVTRVYPAGMERHFESYYRSGEVTYGFPAPRNNKISITVRYLPSRNFTEKEYEITASLGL